MKTVFNMKAFEGWKIKLPLIQGNGVGVSLECLPELW